jgi:hypothetical protein
MGADHGASSAERMRLTRQRRRQGFRCVSIEIREREISALIRRKRLSLDDRTGAPRGRRDSNVMRLGPSAPLQGGDPGQSFVRSSGYRGARRAAFDRRL